MPTATITPSIDFEALTLVGIKAAAKATDALAVINGPKAGYEATLGKTPMRWNFAERRTTNVQVIEHTAVTNFQTGFESYDDSALTTGRPAAYGFAISGLAAKIGQRQVYTYQNSPPAFENWVQQTVGNCIGILGRGWDKRLVAATGAGFADWQTFNGLDSTTGFYERGAKGTQTNVVGGLSKATYNYTPGWQNMAVDMQNAVGSNFYQFDTAVSTIKLLGAPMDKLFGLASRPFVDNVKRYTRAYERYMPQNGNYDSGVPFEMFAGIKFYLDNYMPTDGATTTTYPISAYIIDGANTPLFWLDKCKVGATELPDGHFGVGEWRPVSGLQGVWAMPMACAGQVCADLLGTSGVIVRGNTY